MFVQEYLLRAEFSLPSITDEEAPPERKAPIRVKFEIPYFTVSGIQVCAHELVCFLCRKTKPWSYLVLRTDYLAKLFSMVCCQLFFLIRLGGKKLEHSRHDRMMF